MRQNASLSPHVKETRFDNARSCRHEYPAEHSLHQMIAEGVRTLHNEGHELVITPQVVYEFWSVATRSIKANGLEKPIPAVELLIEKFTGLFRLLRDERAIYETWFGLVKQYEVKGVNSYDARLAAAMLRHNITHLLTTNAKDFRRYPHVIIIEPQSIAT